MRHFGDAIILGTFSALIFCGGASAIERFPPPDFESGYELPSPTTPAPREDVYQYIDVLVLFAALAVSSYLVLRKRSRRLIFALMIFSLAYFGFWRKGCVCPIGAIQNISLSIFDSSYVIGFVGAAFFLLPLVFTVFFGRTFCAAVCPLGAIQDVVLLKPISVPRWLESSLRLFAYVYLGLAVLFAATGSAFVICRYDPFVSFFRLSGNLNLLILGACFLVVGVFVGRPYCRFVCPYGVILRQLSRISKWRVSITPDECIKCRLCEDSCPFGAIEKPTVTWPIRDLGRSKKRLGLMIIVVPVLMAACGWAVSAGGGPMSRMHSTVRLAERIYLEQAGQAEGTTDASSAFRATGRELKELYADAADIQAHFTLGGWIVGGFFGLVIGLKLIRHSLWQQRDDYQAERAGCVACGRCFKYCPREHAGSGETGEAIGQEV